MNKAVQTLLKTQDPAQYSSARTYLKKSIREAKLEKKTRIKDHFIDNDPRRAWQGIKHIRVATPRSPTRIAEGLNCFFANFLC